MSKGLIEWNKIQADWFQKTIRINGKAPQYNYHHKQKSSKPCKVLEINNKWSRLLCGYLLIEIDLSDTLSFIHELGKILKDEKLRKNFALQKAVVRGIVITYYKCFSNTKGRKVKLEEEIIAS
jgi:hypothetical protein